jgi:CTP:molybdopterin cytidylyltransferase MocA
MSTAGLILAAGAGSRFGPEPKQLADMNGRPLLDHVVDAMCAIKELEPVVVVLGAAAERILAHADLMRARPVISEEWANGQASSLRLGLQAVGDVDAVIVTLGDLPTITPAIVARLLDAPPGTRATYDGRPGHPVVLGPAHVNAITRLRGDHGARDLLVGGPTIECATLSSGRDVDTQDDLEAIRRATPWAPRKGRPRHRLEQSRTDA